MSIIALIIFLFVYVAGSMAVSGFTIYTLWNWFMPVIFGLPTLTFWPALGFSLVITYFTSHYSLADIVAQQQASTADKITQFVMPFFKAALYLGLGWLFKSMM